MYIDPIVRFLIPPVSLWLFISGCDELFVDFWFAVRATFGRDSWEVSLDKLAEPREKRIAMFVPCWHEAAVIEQMVEHNLGRIDYHNFDIFLGVYPNDPETIEKASKLERKYPRVHRSVCPEPGPTNKADCLNWIYQRMRLQEEATGQLYDVVVQHDAEDIVHPHSFKLINHLADSYDMIQVPVLPLEMAAKFAVHGTYCDEFAEYQVKDVYTRQSIGGFVPSAGVGTAFRRDALEDIATHYRNQIFNVNTLTEDYEIGLKFQRHGKRQFLVRKAIPLVSERETSEGERAAAKGASLGWSWPGFRWLSRAAEWFSSGNPYRVEYIATREYFPHTFRTAVRQKSRWVMGVALQSWDQLGWNASPVQTLRQTYWLWRDRKGLAGNLITLLSNCIFLYCLLAWGSARQFDTGWNLARVFPPSGIVWWLVPFNTFFILERWFYRIYAVNRVYGPRHAIGVLWRTPLANIINFVSTITAIRLFFSAKIQRREPQWAKTAHAFPTREQLTEYERRLGGPPKTRGATA
jgi:adsorption protein B